ncbi:pre-mrna-splicing factor 38b [Pyrenophora seminiperda CCB06]|uniref:Pre-mrna-splicing factor 38b n=1 Tax=Pyrenophora seminiperda CCB06 TaxID=1302712 RepID=A0A3M7MCU0_9PLEO|nr:pre-mrna-splicing factor 38b [Pyrenophora seminiperda CCB06]
MSLMPICCRINTGAPKPNKSFLRHLIRQTDTYNAALLAKEAEESRARLKRMNREQDGKGTSGQAKRPKLAEGRLTSVPPPDDSREAHPSKRRRHRDKDDTYRERPREEERECSRDAPARRHRDRSRDGRRHKRSHDSGEDNSSRRKRQPSPSPYNEKNRRSDNGKGESRRSRKRDQEERKDRRHRQSRSPSRSSTPRSERHDRRRRHRDHSLSPQTDPTSTRRKCPSLQHLSSSKDQVTSPASDSDPLEAILGPLPPPPEPTVRSKGRGAFKPNSMGIEARFSSTYDPTTDVRANSDAEDDWGDALEAVRDRARWQQQGAERLKAAGFTNDQVKKWEKGDVQNEEDVVWSKKGQAREWDRGKVVYEDGNVELKADFGRLK